MSKKMKTEQTATFANVMELDLADLMVCISLPTEKEASLPTLNHGREDARSWSNPWSTVPTDLAHGWNLHAGAVVVIPVEDLERLGVTNYAKDYKQALIDNVSHLVPDTGLGFYVGTSEGDAGPQDIRITLTRAEIVDYLRGLSINPKFVAISAQRRTFAGFITQLVRKKMGLASYRLPCIQRHFDTVGDLHESQIADNRDNTRRDYSPPGLLSNYLFAIDRNPMETQKSLQLAAGVKTGLGQKLFALAKLERQLELGLVERLRQPVPQDQYDRPIYTVGGPLPFPALDKECCRGLAGLIGKEGAFPEVLKGIFGPDWQPGQIATRKQCEAYFKLAMEGSTRSAALDKTALVKWLNNATPAQRKRPACVAQVIRAIIAGNAPALVNDLTIEQQQAQEDIDAQRTAQ